jgi:hypothetical protein
MRNIRCPSYGQCLDLAIGADLPTFDCSRCRHRHAEDTIDLLEVARCLALIVVVITGARLDPETLPLDDLLTDRRPWRDMSLTEIV